MLNVAGSGIQNILVYISAHIRRIVLYGNRKTKNKGMHPLVFLSPSDTGPDLIDKKCSHSFCALKAREKS